MSFKTEVTPPPPQDHVVLVTYPVRKVNFELIKRIDLEWVERDFDQQGWSGPKTVTTMQDGTKVVAAVRPEVAGLELQVGGFEKDSFKVKSWFLYNVKSITIVESPPPKSKLTVANASDLKRGAKVVLIAHKPLKAAGKILRMATAGEKFVVASDAVTSDGVSVFSKNQHGAPVVAMLPADALALDNGSSDAPAPAGLAPQPGR